jgi:hypothetical protein
LNHVLFLVILCSNARVFGSEIEGLIFLNSVLFLVTLKQWWSFDERDREPDLLEPCSFSCYPVKGSNGGVLTSVRDSIKPPSLTGGAVDFYGATEPLVRRPIGNVKNIVIVRHGLSSWNEEKRIQVLHRPVYVLTHS